MPRLILDLQNPDHLKAVDAEWRFAPGYVPGQPNEGLVSLSNGSPARLPDYDDSDWESILDIEKGRSHGLTFGWYRITVTLPETVQGQSIQGRRCWFETCVDDYGEVWVNGECDRQRGTAQGFNIPQRVQITTDPKPGDKYTIAVLAVNGPLGAPGGGIFVRYGYLSFE